jgi:hypothetical protein
MRSLIRSFLVTACKAIKGAEFSPSPNLRRPLHASTISFVRRPLPAPSWISQSAVQTRVQTHLDHGLLAACAFPSQQILLAFAADASTSAIRRSRVSISNSVIAGGRCGRTHDRNAGRDCCQIVPGVYSRVTLTAGIGGHIAAFNNRSKQPANASPIPRLVKVQYLFVW